jgi:hypothetical protein
MRVFPSSGEEKLDFLLFPFKVYVIIIPIWAFLMKQAPFSVRSPAITLTQWVLVGYALCVLVLIVGGVIQLLTKRRRPAAINLLFGTAGFIALFYLLPYCSVAK